MTLCGSSASIDHRNSSSTSVTGYDYAYDALSQLTSMTFTKSTYAGESMNYGYDVRRQLKTADRQTGADESYSYDSNGNRTVDNGTSQTIGSGNRLTSDGEYTYTYDNEGNRTSRSKSGEYTEYVWDHRNRLTDVITRPDAGGTPTKTVTHE